MRAALIENRTGARFIRQLKFGVRRPESRTPCPRPGKDLNEPPRRRHGERVDEHVKQFT